MSTMRSPEEERAHSAIELSLLLRILSYLSALISVLLSPLRLYALRYSFSRRDLHARIKEAI